MAASVQPLRAPPHASTGLRGTPLELAEPSHRQWPVDAQALARCRALLSGHSGGGVAPDLTLAWERLVDVPPAYESFCRSHFASVRRMRPELDWNDARPAYALALAAHAVLCEALDDEGEDLLAMHWEGLRGGSRLDWSRARPLLADGCRALSRLDPLAMHR
jgi:hypothetical protein